MSDPRRVEGERAFCHQCWREWDRARGGLTCPHCEGEFVEIVRKPAPAEDQGLQAQLSPEGSTNSPSTMQSRPASEPPSPPPHPFADHNPWRDAPDPDEDDITTFQFNALGGGPEMLTFTSRTYRSRGNGMPPPIFPFTTPGFGGQQLFPGQQPAGLGRVEGRGGLFSRDMRGQPGPGEMQDLFSMIFQTMQHGGLARTRPAGAFGGATRGAGIAPSPFDLLGAILNPTGRPGDAVWSQEQFDRILEQLAEQNSVSTAPGPASEAAIKSLPTKKVDESIMGNDGQAECSICMDNVEVGGTVTELPCKHWFHGECVAAWLKEHDTCPHCRKPITAPEDQQAPSARRSSRQAPSNSTYPAAETFRNHPLPGSPDSAREARNFYFNNPNQSAYAEGRQAPYASQQMPERARRHSISQNGRQSSSRHNSDRGAGGSGGVTGWVRNHLWMG